MKVLECGKCLYLFGLEKRPKKNNPTTDFSHGLFKEQFYKQKWESIRSAQAFFTGWGSFVLDDWMMGSPGFCMVV